MRRLSLTDLYGSESEYRRAVAAREAERLEFTYPPRVQEALDFIERETKAYEERERDAADRERLFRERQQQYSRRREAAEAAAASHEKFLKARRMQKEAQEARRRFQPPQIPPPP